MLPVQAARNRARSRMIFLIVFLVLFLCSWAIYELVDEKPTCSANMKRDYSVPAEGLGGKTLQRVRLGDYVKSVVILFWLLVLTVVVMVASSRMFLWCYLAMLDPTETGNPTISKVEEQRTIVSASSARFRSSVPSLQPPPPPVTLTENLAPVSAPATDTQLEETAKVFASQPCESKPSPCPDAFIAAKSEKKQKKKKWYRRLLPSCCKKKKKNLLVESTS